MERLTSNIDYCETYCENEKNRCPIYSSCINRRSYEKAKDYEDAEEKGLLPKFYLGYEFWIEWCGKILKAKIVMLQQKKDGTWKYRFCDERSHTMDYEENKLGKYFFDTKEEAERALKQMGE